eukprot:TRINITY_DN73690_c0_g1_i1.p1 TRINITY_DN73690_c0_g1~~TRINITY_DN73690_c0_g1_i1.p1  ORF type:complete len:166 (+),score=30.26 TRINITY_DN73690_c0_g1_i1:1-498(+)
MKSATQKATFGAGCFWGVEKYFRKHFPKLKSTSVGYAGGSSADPTYKAVCTGKTGHAEVVDLEYDEKETPYRDLVVFFFRVHDPTTLNRQGPDTGTQYRSAIFYHSPEQKKIAEEVVEEMKTTHYKGQKIVTEIVAFTKYYKAEDYHQLYLDANPDGYCTHKLRW